MSKAENVVYLSYGCPYKQCGDAHTHGFVDPDDAREHMQRFHFRGMTRPPREPVVIRWPRWAKFYEAFGVKGPM